MYSRWRRQLKIKYEQWNSYVIPYLVFFFPKYVYHKLKKWISKLQGEHTSGIYVILLYL